jgi:hypothetical protein
MSILKGKKRALSPAGSTTAQNIVITVLAKDTFPRMKALDTFSSDRKKFKAYETEYRVYF